MIANKFKYRNADGVQGILISSFGGGPHFFRIYEKNGDFKDYEIRHDDVRVKILDDSAELIVDCALETGRLTG